MSRQDLWVVTTYFNPMRYHRRRWNYQWFRRRLNVPLVAVEASFEPQFELQSGDADVLVQIPCRDVMWQKEFLLSVALAALPRTCRYVAWVDCDLIFSRHDWAEQASRLLERFALVQLFSQVHHQPPDWTPTEGPQAPLFTHRSLAAGLARGQTIDECLGKSLLRREPGAWVPGHAWAARRELLERHGFYTGSVVGGGDTMLDCAAFGTYESAHRFHAMNERQRRYYQDWAEPFHKSVRGAVAHLEGDLFHLWHGDMVHRQGEDRHVRLSQIPFDPFQDLTVDANGCGSWKSDKLRLHDYVRSFFARRREDG